MTDDKFCGSSAMGNKNVIVNNYNEIYIFLNKLTLSLLYDKYLITIR